MGIAEETGKVAAGILDVMKASPLVLGLLLVIFALIGFVYLQSSQFNTARAENVKLFVQVQSEVQKLLSQCIVPPPSGASK
jgi:membrane-anchored glycerophosphoryl diester phosphodiesterase (GDPDase)